MYNVNGLQFGELQQSHFLTGTELPGTVISTFSGRYVVLYGYPGGWSVCVREEIVRQKLEMKYVIN